MKKLISIALVLSLLMASSAFAKVKIKSLAKKKWTVVESQNFKVITDVSARKARLTVEQLEEYRAFCSFFLNIKANDDDAKLLLYVTDSRRTWKAMGLNDLYVSVHVKRPANSPQMFVDVKGFFGNNFKVANSGRSVVLNAVAQQLFTSAGLDQSYPLWFRTGFAYYLATYTESSDQIVLGSVEAYRYRYSTLFNQGGGLKSFNSKALLARKKLGQKAVRSSKAKSLRLANQEYMQSFFTVHYLYADNSRRKQMVDYLRAVVTGKSQDQAFSDAFSMSYEEFDKQLRRYVSGRSLSARAMDRKQIRESLIIPAAESYSVRSIDDTEFFKLFAQAIIELQEETISNQDKQSFINEYKERYKPETMNAPPL
ncbi:MAG: hypothetical protein ACJA2E_001196 [Arenicella sp.]|jgi:hypothetical protein